MLGTWYLVAQASALARSLRPATIVPASLHPSSGSWNYRSPGSHRMEQPYLTDAYSSWMCAPPIRPQRDWAPQRCYRVIGQ
jgi:hypothetical protein